VCVCVCDALLHKRGGGGEEEGTESVGTRQYSLCCARLMPRMPKPNVGWNAVINERESVCECVRLSWMANIISRMGRQPLHGRRVERCLLGAKGGARGRESAVDASDR